MGAIEDAHPRLAALPPLESLYELQQIEPCPYKAGDLIQVWSNSSQAWMDGCVTKIEDDTVVTEFWPSEGGPSIRPLPGRRNPQPNQVTKFALCHPASWTLSQPGLKFCEFV